MRASPETHPRRALEELRRRVAGRDGITGTDLSYDPALGPPGEPAAMVLRVHVARGASVQALDLPREIDGVPVRVVVGEYGME